VDADDSSEGSEFSTTASSTVLDLGLAYTNFPIKVKAGETTVHVINDNAFPSEFGDLDGDLLPDHLEDAIIDALAGDGLDTYEDVTPNGDFDHDGLQELVEAALGTNPLSSDVDALKYEQRDGFLYLRHDETAADYGLEIIGQRSANLELWSAENVSERIIEIRPDGRTKEWGIPIDDSNGFLRILVRGRQ
jgi:hypothetical protein